MTLPPSGSTYESILNGYFYNAPTAEKSEIWEDFSSTHPGATPQDFLLYVQDVYEDITTESFKTQEQHKRQLLFDIFDMILLLANDTTNSVAMQGDQSLFDTLYRNEYTKLMTKVPVYKGGTPTYESHVGAPPNTISGMTFGFDAISVNDILTYVTVKGENFTLRGKDGNVTLNFVQNATPPYVEFRTLSPDASIVKQNVTGITSTSTQAEKMAAWTAAVNSLFADSKVSINQDTGEFTFTLTGGTVKDTFAIPWRLNEPAYGGSPTDDKDRWQAVQNRQARNQLLQQYTQAAQTRSQSIADKLLEVQANIESSMSSRKGQIGIMRSTIEQLQTILGTLFK